MGSDTDRLVEEASRGDGAAVESLLARFLPGLQRYVRRHAGPVVAARESSSDLVQSVCREVLEHLGSERLQYRGEAEFKQWLYQAAVFKLRHRQRHWRADKRDAGREVELASTDRLSQADVFFRSLCSPSSEAALHEELERLRRAFDQLPESYREIIGLAQFEGLSHKQIAERLDIGEAVSRTRLSRALARLATLSLPPDER